LCYIGTQLPLLQRDITPPPFSANTCYGQVAGWIKMSFGREVGLGPGDIELDGDPAPPPQKGHRPPPIFWSKNCGQTAGRIKMPFGMEVGLGPGHNVLVGTQLTPRGAQPHNFLPMSIVATRSHISATAEYLLWPPHYIFARWFLSSFFFHLTFPRLISAVADWMSTILPHMVWP